MKFSISSKFTKPLARVGRYATAVASTSTAGASQRERSFESVRAGAGRAAAGRRRGLLFISRGDQGSRGLDETGEYEERAPPGGPGPGPPSMHDERWLLHVVGAKLAHLFLHGRAARLERARETGALFLEVVATLPDQIGSFALRLRCLLLRLLEPLLAVLAQELARFRPGLGRQEQRGGRAGDGAEGEPAQIARCVSTMPVRHVAASLRHVAASFSG